MASSGHRFALRHRRWGAAIAVLLAIAGGWAGTDLPIRLSSSDLLPANNRSVRDLRDIRYAFYERETYALRDKALYLLPREKLDQAIEDAWTIFLDGRSGPLDPGAAPAARARAHRRPRRRDRRRALSSAALTSAGAFAILTFSAFRGFSEVGAIASPVGDRSPMNAPFGARYTACTSPRPKGRNT